MTIPRGNVQTLEEIEVVEEHLHTEQLCLGDTGGVLADGSLTPFQLTTGTVGVFGSELQIYAGAFGAGVLMDLDKVVVVALQRTAVVYLVEFWAGSGAFGAATRVASFYCGASGTPFRFAEYQVRSPRVRGDLNIWARAKSGYATASTIDILFMSHKYPSDSGDVVTS